MGRLTGLRFLWFGLVLAVLWTAGLAQAEPRRYALVVGVREYPLSRNLPLLDYTEPDANEIAATLQKSGFQVTLMTQTASEGPSNRRFAPNAALIRKQFTDLVQTPFLTKEDCVLLVLGGHGIQLPSKDDSEQQTYYFCPADASIEGLKHSNDVTDRNGLLSVQELYDTLKKSEAGVKLLVVDACRNDPNKPGAFRSANSVTRPPVPVPPGGIAALFSCSATEAAVEDAELKHGVFSHYLIQGLNGAADLDGDKQIDITELHRYVGSRTFDHVRQKHSRQQLPELKGEIKGWAPLLSLPEIQIAGVKAGEVRTLGGIKFCWCPPGKFTMGSPASEQDRDKDEQQVSVTLTRGFWLGQYEVTQAEWEKIMGTTPWKEKGYTKEGGTHPATWISWQECNDFCQKLTSQGRTDGWLPKDWQVDLPTEAQWEYACRAGTQTRYSFGEDESLLNDYAWWGGVYGGGNADKEMYAHEVGQKKANTWNFYDMHGNVSEWCRISDEMIHPDGSDSTLQTRAIVQVSRGGSWYFGAGSCRSASRYVAPPIPVVSFLGFRVAAVQTR